MKYATFDLEIANGFPDNGNWRESAPLGITCAALGLTGKDEPKFYQGVPSMPRAECQEMVRELQQVVKNGYVLVTWNGTAFDFAVLAEEAEMPRECAELALAHVDLMVIVTFKRGHFLGLQKALDGAGFPGKLHEVTLNDGTLLTDMTGKLAPRLWADGEYSAVLSYLREDVMPLLELSEWVARKKQIRWTSNKGYPNTVVIEKLYTVRECFNFPLPDTNWMKTDPPSRERFIEWMPPLDDIIPATSYTKRELRDLPMFAYTAEGPYWQEFRYLLQAK